ncbi:MAG: hypothetical protein ACREGH_02755, partial [Minisyncoccia bacterium]
DEYNRYLEGANLLASAEIDAQTTYFGATNILLRAGRLIDMAVAKDSKHVLDFCKRFSEKDMGIEESPRDLVLRNSGLELEHVVHRYAFESLSEDMKKDLLALCPDAATESQYLDTEEAIAEAFNGKNKLTAEAKEKLAGLIVASLYNRHAALFRKLKTDSELREDYFFGSYYGELPAFEILGKWAFYNNQMPENAEDLLRHLPDGKEYENDSEEVSDLFESVRKELAPRLADYAEKHKRDVGEILKETLLRWLDEGLFTKDFTPIWNSNAKETCNGVDTKLPHKEVFEEWLQAKRKAEWTISGLIDTGELKIEDRVDTIRGFRKDEDTFTRPLRLITGESLYDLTGDYSFADDYKTQADDFAGLGGLIVFLREYGFLKEYAVLLKFLELFTRISKLYEIDLTYPIVGRIAAFKSDVEMLNSEIAALAENLRQASNEKNDDTFLIEILVEDMLIDLKQVEPDKGAAERYFTEFEKLFGVEFKSHEEPN